MRCTILILIIIACSCKKQLPEHRTSRLDSVTYYLSENAHDQRFQSLKKAYQFTVAQPNDSITRGDLFKIAEKYYAADKQREFEQVANLAYKYSVEAKDTISIAKAFRYKAESYTQLGYSDSAFQALQSAEKLYIKVGDNINRGKVLYKKAIIQYDANDILGADLSISQAYNLLKKSNDYQLIFQTLSMTGIIANALEDYDKAIEFHSKALEIVNEGNLDVSLYQRESTLNNLGGVYQRIGNNTMAIDKFEQALKVTHQFENDRALYALLLDNLAYSKFFIKDFERLPELFLKSLKIRDSLDHLSSVIVSKIHLSEYYEYFKDSAKAKRYANEAHKVAVISRSPVNLLLSLKQLSVIDRANASQYSLKYIKINDSLQQAERKSRDKFVKLQLETRELELEKDQLAEQNRTLLYFFVVTFMIGVLLFVIRMQRARNRELLLKQSQQKANEEIYNLMISQQSIIEESRVKEKKRIAQELHDGVLGRLFGTRLNLDSLNKSSAEGVIELRNTYLIELKNIEQDIREISHDLNREKYVIINNFLAILANLIEDQKALFKTNVKVSFDDSIKWELINNTIKITLYRIIQEGLQNINKYSQATEITIGIKLNINRIMMTLSDNGIGFDVTGKKKGIGLQNMVSRVNELNGVIDIKSKKGKGTQILIELPID